MRKGEGGVKREERKGMRDKWRWRRLKGEK